MSEKPAWRWTTTQLVACLVLYFASVWNAATPANAQWKVESDFPGGAAEVVAIDQQLGRISFGVPKEQNGGWRKWWCFKVTGIRPGQTVKLAGPEPKQPVFSLDGKNWRFMSSQEAGQQIDARQAWFAWYVPFVPSDSEAFIRRATAACDEAQRFELCRSEGGIPVAGIQFGKVDDPDTTRPAIWIQARQHAWEVGGSWVAAGLIDWLAGEDPVAVGLRRKATITVIPIMDVDSVTAGRGGKNQKPHDHNRDWSTQPHWEAVAAAVSRLRTLNAQGRLELFMDVHDPGYKGGLQIWCANLKAQPEPRRTNTIRFAAILRELCQRRESFWRPGGVHQPGYLVGLPASANWVKTHCAPHVVGCTMEVGVAPPGGAIRSGKGAAADSGSPVIPPNPHLELGAVLGASLARYLTTPTRTTPESPVE